MDRKKAYLMIPEVVDGEVSENEKAAFLDFIRHHPDIKEEYENAIYVKKLLSKKLKRIEAPEHLRLKIKRQIKEFDNKNLTTDQELDSRNQLNRQEPLPKYSGTVFRIFSAVAVVLIISLITVQLLNRTDHGYEYSDMLMVEQAAVEHFGSFSESLLTNIFSSNEISEAQNYLVKQHNFDATIPKITGTEFNGVVLANISSNFSTPVLEYVHEDSGEKIYLFVFDIDSINNSRSVYRHDEAVKHCITKKDYYVAEIDQHHVVSWVWDKYWYSAVSNHNGHDLAALVEPLN